MEEKLCPKLIIQRQPNFTKRQPSRIALPPNITAKRTTLLAPNIAPRLAVTPTRRTRRRRMRIARALCLTPRHNACWPGRAIVSATKIVAALAPPKAVATQMLLRMRLFSVLRGVLPRHRKCVKPLRMSRLWNGLARRQYGFGKRESDLSVWVEDAIRSRFPHEL